MIGISSIISIGVSVTKELVNIGMTMQGLKIVTNTLIGVAKGLGLIKSECKVEDLGDKALQAEEKERIVPENYQTYEAYVKAIDDFEVDLEKSKMIPEDEKVRKGTEIAVGLTMEHFPDIQLEDFFECVGKNMGYFTAERISEIMKLLSNNPKHINDILTYINGTEKNPKAIENTMNTLIGVEKKVNPNINDVDAMYKVASIRK